MVHLLNYLIFHYHQILMKTIQRLYQKHH